LKFLIKTGSRSPGFTYPDEEFFYWACAKKFGWTPNEVDEQPASIVEWVLSINSAIDEVKAEMSRANEPKRDRKSR
jgi:hypothetical protein